MTKISIVVPVYNVEKYLGECLESIVKQTLKDIEIICVNDGSTDNSLDIIKAFAQNDERIKIIDKKNSGYGDSMNKGIKAATGEYIGIIESDDFVDADMFKSLYTLAKENDCDIVKSDWYNYWTKGSIKEKNGRVKDFNAKVTNVKEHPEILTLQPTLWSAIYKKQLISNIKFLTTPGASYQDTSVSFKLFASAHKILFTNKAYVYYRQDNVNSSINNPAKALYVCEEYDEIDKFLSQHKDIKDIINTQKLIAQYKAYRWTMKRIAPEYRKDFVMRVSQQFLQYNNNKELTKEFFNKYGKKKIECLINSPEQFLINYEKNVLKKEKWKMIRKNIFSVKINKSRINVKIFGKQIINIG